jgi:diaminopimelate epimerase
MKEDNECDYFILLNMNDLNYNWIIFNKKGIVEKSNGNDLMAVAKYLHTENNVKYGEILDNKYIFKYDNNKYYFQMEEPKEYTLKDEYTQNLKQLIEQLTGLNVVGMSKYIMGGKHLIIEIKDDLFNFDTDIIKTICSIINGEGNNFYNISFINLLENNLIRVKYYDSEKQKETDGNAYSCLAIFDYYAYVNEISYETKFDLNLILNKDNIKIIYKDNKYFISY